MRIKLPSFDEKKALFEYLKKNKADLITQKKQLPIKSDGIDLYCVDEQNEFDVITTKSTPKQTDNEPFQVEVIANLANWMDSHDDVMLADSWKKSITEKGNSIPMLKDHEHTVTAKIAKTLAVYSKNVSIADMGYTSDIKKSQALIFKIQPMESWDAKCYMLYKDGEINQHSIGLQYVQLDLAINDGDYKEEYATWQKYYSQIINKKKADGTGYFWAVKEAKIFENSAVLFGSNSMTPVYSSNEKTLPAQDAAEKKNVNSNAELKRQYYLNLLKN